MFTCTGLLYATFQRNDMMDKIEKEEAKKLIEGEVNANIEEIDNPLNVLSKQVSNIIGQLSILQGEILMLKKKMKDQK